MAANKIPFFLWILSTIWPFVVIATLSAFEARGVPIVIVGPTRQNAAIIFATGYVFCLVGIALANPIGVLQKIILAVLTMPFIFILNLSCTFVAAWVFGFSAS